MYVCVCTSKSPLEVPWLYTFIYRGPPHTSQSTHLLYTILYLKLALVSIIFVKTMTTRIFLHFRNPCLFQVSPRLGRCVWRVLSASSSSRGAPASSLSCWSGSRALSQAASWTHPHEAPRSLCDRQQAASVVVVVCIWLCICAYVCTCVYACVQCNVSVSEHGWILGTRLHRQCEYPCQFMHMSMLKYYT